MHWLIAPPKESRLEPLKTVLQGKTVLITGASYGIGEATALLLAKAGATVLLLARTEQKLRAIQQEIGSTAFMYPVDLSQLEQLKTTLLEIRAKHPKIDIVVCNAGKSIRRHIEESYERADLERLIALNFSSPSTLILELLPYLLVQGGAQIINVSSLAVRLPGVPMWAAYQSSKTGFDIWLQSLGNELRPRLYVTSIYLGLVRTRMSQASRAFDGAPALTPLEAAHVIAYAIIKKPSRVAPWWLRLAEIMIVLFAAPINVLLIWLYRFSTRKP